jgi:hypothetical protein
MHRLPAVAQSCPPQTPLLQPSEQQSAATRQRAPSAWQYWAQTRPPRRPRGSHRWLQQPLRALHGSPGAAQVPDGRQ